MENVCSGNVAIDLDCQVIDLRLKLGLQKRLANLKSTLSIDWVLPRKRPSDSCQNSMISITNKKRERRRSMMKIVTSQGWIENSSVLSSPSLNWWHASPLKLRQTIAHLCFSTWRLRTMTNRRDKSFKKWKTWKRFAKADTSTNMAILVSKVKAAISCLTNQSRVGRQAGLKQAENQAFKSNQTSWNTANWSKWQAMCPESKLKSDRVKIYLSSQNSQTHSVNFRLFNKEIWSM